MGIHDILFEWLGNACPEQLAASVVGARRVRLRALPREVPLLKRQADFAAVVHFPGATRVLHVEHVKGRADLRRVVVRHALYHDLTGLPVETWIVQSDRRLARTMPPVYRFGVGRRKTCVPLRRLRLWALRAEAVLRASRIALYPFVAIMVRGRREPRSLLEETKRRIIRDLADEKQRSEMLAAVGIISADVLGAALVEQVLGGIAEMGKTTIGQKLMDMGRAEGRVEARVEVLLVVLESRFGRVPEAIRRRIAGITSETEIERLVRAAATADSLDAVFPETKLGRGRRTRASTRG